MMPENTLVAFEKAIALGVHTLELYVVISKDRQVIVSHEPYMSRYICLDSLGRPIPVEDDMKYNIYRMNHSEIMNFDCGSKYVDNFPNQKKIKTYKPRLDEVFSLATSLRASVKYNIEIKAKPKYDEVYTPDPKEFVELVIQSIDRHAAFDSCNLQSFDLRILEEIKRQAPGMKIAILVDEFEDISTKLAQLSYKPDIISPYFKLLDQEKVSFYKQKGFEIIPWTVNTKADMMNMMALDVDAIITDYPDVLMDLLNKN